MVGNPARFPLAEKLSPEQLQERLDSGISFLREVARILAVLYDTPDLGNKADLTDELVYIILSRKTRESAYKKGFKALKERFRTWDELLAGSLAGTYQGVSLEQIEVRLTRTSA
jgi:hypothetical protein